MPPVMTTCPFCGCGCGMYLHVNGGRVVGVGASPSHPVGQGRLCVKGWHAHEVTNSSERLRTPLVRRGKGLEEATWGEALELVAGRIGEIKAAKGARAVGLLGSTRCTNEDNFLLMKFARCALGSNNVDFCARLEALPALFDLQQYRRLTLSDACLGDIDRADLILLWQADPAEEHPAAAARIIRAAQRGVPVIEVGWRSGQMGKLAQMHLPLRPPTGVQLVAGLLNVILCGSGPPPADVETLAASVADCNPDWTEAATGVPAAVVRQAGEALARAARPLIICTRSATLGPDGTEVLMTLHVLGRLKNHSSPGWSALLWLSHNSNLQGARDMGVVPHFLTGYQVLSDRSVREKFERAWRASLPTEPGLSAWEMPGQVRALLVMGDDPIGALPASALIRNALADLDFLVVQDIFLSPTAQAAHVVLPGATFAEKDGTFTSTEHRVQRVRKATEPLGQARADWEILCALSRRMGYPMEYASPAQIMEEITALTPLYAGVSYQALDDGFGIRLPVPDVEQGQEIAPGTGGSTHEPVSVREMRAPEVTRDFPLLLMADHALGAWADDALVACSVSLRREVGRGRLANRPVVEMSPADASENDLRDGQTVCVRSRNGEMKAKMHINPAVCSGVLVLPFMMREAAAAVMPASLDAETGLPVLLPCAVRVEKEPL